jgi:hypothetical protein
MALSTIMPLISVECQGSSFEGKGLRDNHAPPLNTEAKNAWSITSIDPYATISLFLLR